jgi:hypothetical protein
VDLDREKCCGAKGRGDVPFYRVGEAMKGKGGSRRRGGD